MTGYRKQYKWGAKAFLVSMEVGETRYNDGSLNWRGVQCMACRLSADFPCKWKFRTKHREKSVTRIL